MVALKAMPAVGEPGTVSSPAEMPLLADTVKMVEVPVMVPWVAVRVVLSAS